LGLGVGLGLGLGLGGLAEDGSFSYSSGRLSCSSSAC
jgi:hypothetical protein